MGRHPAPTIDDEAAVEFRRRWLGEIEMAVGILGVSEAELCRRAGFATNYLHQIRSSEKYTDGKVEFPSPTFMLAVEKTWGVRFQITVVPHESVDHNYPHFRRGKAASVPSA